MKAVTNILYFLKVQQRGEAQVRVVQKGDPATSGVVRVNNAPTRVVQRTIIKSTPQGNTRQSNILAKPNITTRPAPPRNQQPVRQIISQTNKTTIGQTSLAQQVSLTLH